MLCDFHLHTHRSDGELSPGQLRSAVQRQDVAHFAVTDHDTFGGYAALRGTPGLIPGVEVTAGWSGREVHLVGLGVDPGHAGLNALLASIRSTRLQRLRLLIGRLPAQVARGLTLELLQAEKEFLQAECFGRLHLAKALVKRGGVASVHAAFAEHLGDESLARSPVDEAQLPPYPHPTEVCVAIRAAGGVAILAHPGIYGDMQRIGELLDLGCDGVEIDHPNLDPLLKEQLAQVVTTRQLLASSGSDLHYLGYRKPGGWSLSRDQFRPLLERLGIPA